MPAEIEALQHDLKEARESLALVEERIADYVLSIEVPLQLIKEQRHLLGADPRIMEAGGE